MSYAYFSQPPNPNPSFSTLSLGKTITPNGTTGDRTINTALGTVRFAAAATSLTVTNSLVTVNSIILVSVNTVDTTMKSVTVTPGAGSFVITANSAATAETGVSFCVFN